MHLEGGWGAGNCHYLQSIDPGDPQQERGGEVQPYDHLEPGPLPLP